MPTRTMPVSGRWTWRCGSSSRTSIRLALPSLVTVCFSLAGGTGSGMVVDLARHLSNVKLGRRIPVIGVGQLPHSGDPEMYRNNPTLYTTLNDLDCMLDDDKNAGVTAVWGDLYRSPFTGGFFVVNPEQSWQRLTAYTTTGEKLRSGRTSRRW